MSRPSLARWTDDDTPTDRQQWSVMVGGDTVFTETSPPEIGDELQEAIARADLSLANLEAPISGAGMPISKVGPVNETVAETPLHLRDMGFDAVTLANNHAMDHGSEGLRHTIEQCTSAGLDTCGAGESPSAALDPLSASVAGHSVAVINVCEREFGTTDRGGPGTGWIDHPDVTARIADAATTADSVVVVAHGGLEYLPVPPLDHQRRLREFADAGASLVVSHHPHVPQGWEQYRGTPICYSLGNFRYKRGTRPKTEWGLLVDATFSGDAVAFMGERWEVSEYQRYFDRVSRITADRETLRAHWQEVAVRVFEQRYGPWLRTATGSDLPSLLRHPLQYLRGDRLWDGDKRQRELLTLLNLVRNESHRDLIQTALAVKTGTCPEQRSDEVRDTVRELLEWTEDRPVYDRPSSAGRLVDGVLGRLQGAVSRTGSRLRPNLS